MVITSFVSTIALYFMRPWGRIIFVLSIIVMAMLESQLNYPVLKTPVEYSIDSITGLISGLIIAIIYWTSIPELMNRKKT